MDSRSEKPTSMILVVDDTPQNVQVLSNLLHSAGYGVVAAFNGADALEMAKERQPDLILLDIVMPEMDGFETCKAFKNQEETKNIPILFLSALSDIGDKVKAFELGGQDYITKPFQQKEVLARVKTHMRLYQLERERLGHIKQLEEQKKQLEKLSKTKDEVLRIVSHDMRNPLNGVIGISNLLRTEADTINDEEAEEMLQAIENSGEQMLTIVNDLLNAARIEAEELSVQRERVVLDDFMNQVLSLQRPTAQHKEIVLQTEIEDPEAEVYIDSAKSAQILGNLVSNAIKFTPQKGTITVKAKFKACDETHLPSELSADKCLQFVVEDTGIGIPNKYQDNLFDVSSKYRRKGTAGEASSGMGLWIIKQFTDVQRGHINVESQEDKGTTFTVTLPLLEEQS